MTWINCKCPKCGIDLEILVPRWHSVTECKSCNAKLFIDFDIALMDDMLDNYDLYDVQLWNGDDESWKLDQLEYSNCQLADA